MRQLLPEATGQVDAYDVYRPADPFVPLLRVNMVISGDGSATDAQGRSAGLAGDGDRQVFRALRALADAILVGAATARIEGYGPHRLTERLATRRAGDSRRGPAAVVVVSRSLDLDPDSRLFRDAVTPTVLLTCAAAPPERLAALENVARVVVAGDERVDLTAGLARLRSDLGLTHVLCEGGPTLNAQLLAAGLVDEWCATLSPLLIAGQGPLAVRGPVVTVPMTLLALCEHEGELYARYRIDGRA